jgi:xanthine dehydrogenase small subunit
MKITLTVNGRAHAVEAPPLRRLLDILREDFGLTGTKEGCGEGECGACAVLLDGELVNACLVPALQLDGREVATIEGLGTRERPDPVQEAFLEEGAVQCGFCIPGMVMATRALLDRQAHPSRAQIRRALAGNLCRCTGYARIFRAVERAAGTATVPRAGMVPDRRAPAGRATLGAVGPAVHRPTALSEALATLRDAGGVITVVAGATDLLAEIKLGRPEPRAVLDVMGLPELAEIAREDGALTIGATVCFSAIAGHADVRAHFPALAEAAAQIGAVAIQNRATLGGNLMTASPAADAPPVLLALGASAVLASSAGARVQTRAVPVAEFYSGYRRSVRRPEELLIGVRVPMPAPGTQQAFYKVGPRQAQSIAKVSLAASARLEDGLVLRDVRLAAGSVAPTVVALTRTQAFVEGRSLGPQDAAGVIAQAEAIAAGEVAPIDDVRSTAEYRRAVLGGLVGRFLRAAARGGR